MTGDATRGRDRTEIHWCFTHRSQVVWVRDGRGLRSWCAIGDDVGDEESCSAGGARVVFPEEDGFGVGSHRNTRYLFGSKGAFVVSDPVSGVRNG